MASEKIEIEVLVNGKPAVAALNKVENKTKSLGVQTKKTGKKVDGVLTKMRAGWIAVGLATAKAVTAGKTFERMSLGLTKSQKAWAKETALLTDITADQVAGFLKSAQTAGLTEDVMKSLAEQAIALGYAFPHEAAETLHDNLVMLHRTGEAQGFVVDILEQKYSAMGESIVSLDLKTKSVAEKIALVGQVAEKSQGQMDDSEYKALDKTAGILKNTLVDLGDAFVGMFDALGGTTAIEGVSALFKLLESGGKSVRALWNDSKENQLAAAEASLKYLDAMEKVTGNKSWSTQSDEAGMLRTVIHGIRKELNGVNKEFDGLIVRVSGGGADNLWNWTDELKEKLSGVGEGLKIFARKGKAELDTLRGVGEKVGQGIEDAFVNMATGVKTSFKDMAKAIMADLIRIQVRKMIIQGMSLFHTGTAEVKHTGGAIGSSMIPSFHTGMRSDERLAKLQVGEAVINRGGAAKNRSSIEAMNKGYAVGGGGGNVTTAEINFNVQAIDAASFNSYLINNKGTIEGIINSSLASNGSVRRTIKQVV